MELSLENANINPLLVENLAEIPSKNHKNETLPHFEMLLVKEKELYKAIEAEEKVFAFSGLKVHDEIQIFDVPLKYGGKNYIHTVRCGSPNSPPLVLIHGYGGSSVTFYKIIKDLSQKYQVFCIDLLGMGLSSRPKFELISTEECISFFVESLEEWRKILKINDFTLIGHSLGGYISVNYALRYKAFLRRLFLMSPAGISGIEENFDLDEYLKNSGFMRRQFVKLASKLWQKKYTPNKLYQKTGFLGRYALKLYVTKRWSSSKEEGKALQAYFDKILSMPPSSEAALHYLLKMPKARAIIPMEEYIKKDLQKLQVVFLYGDFDWMDTTGAMRLFKTQPNVDYHQINGAGHHANMDQPTAFCKIILSYLI